MTQHYFYSGKAYTTLMNKAYEKMYSLATEEDIFVYDLTMQSFSEVYEDLITPPLFSDKKVICVKHFEVVLQEDSFVEILHAYLKNPNEGVYLLCLSEHKDGSKDWMRLIDLYMEIEEVDVFNEIELNKYITTRLEKEAIKISKEDRNFLSDRLLLQKDLIEMQLDKLITFVIDKKTIFKEDIITCIDIPLEDNIFEMVQQFIQKNIQHVLKIYQDLIYLNEDPIRIINVIGRKLGQLEDIKVYLNQGLDQRKISEILKVSHGQAYYLIKEAKSIDQAFLRQKIDALSDLDFKIKSGQIDKKIGLEIFLIGVSNE